MHSVGLRQHLLSDATLFMRLVRMTHSYPLRAHLLHEYRVPNYVQKLFYGDFYAVHPESENFLQALQHVLWTHLFDVEKEMLHSPLKVFIMTDDLHDDTIRILKHMFGNKTIDDFRGDRRQLDYSR
eukprot:5598275-Pleurochrysis_carterae.AAC.1